MAMYKVPQDVEVADKILGPLSLKQFIFAILFFASCYIDFVLFQVFFPLLAIGLPFTIVFAVLAFYQRSDQPVEVYLMSAIRFYTKSRKRVWSQDGYEEKVEITAPKTMEIQRTKGFTESQVKSNLNDLAKMMDTHGWASKNIDALDSMGVSSNGRILNITDIQSVPDANDAELMRTNQQHDILDESSTSIARKFNSMVEQRAVQIRQQALAQVQNAQVAASQPAQTQPAPAITGVHATTNSVHATPIKPPVVTTVSPIAQARINQLAGDDSETIATIARKADEMSEDSGEIELR